MSTDTGAVPTTRPVTHLKREQTPGPVTRPAAEMAAERERALSSDEFDPHIYNGLTLKEIANNTSLHNLAITSVLLHGSMATLYYGVAKYVQDHLELVAARPATVVGGLMMSYLIMTIYRQRFREAGEIIRTGLRQERLRKRCTGMFAIAASQHTYDNTGYMSGMSSVDWANIVAGLGWIVMMFLELKIM